MTASPDRKRMAADWIALEREAAKDEAELVEAMEDMDVDELENVRDMLDEIIDRKRAAAEES